MALQLTKTLKVANAPPSGSPAVVTTASSGNSQATGGGSTNPAPLTVTTDLATALLRNLFPTDATLGGVLELHGLTYTRPNPLSIGISATSVTLFYGQSFQATFTGDSVHAAL
jgi:hypothetical protein